MLLLDRSNMDYLLVVTTSLFLCVNALEIDRKKIFQSFKELSVCNFEEISEERNAQFPLPDRQQQLKRSKKLKIHIAYLGFKVPCEIWF